MPDINRATELSRLLEHERGVRKRILSIFGAEERAIRRWRNDLPIALVLGGPRCGTSAFKGTLSKHSALLSLSGEHRIFFTLLGLNFPDGSAEKESGNQPLSDEQREEILEMLLMSAFGGPEVKNPTDREALRYAWDWAYRLPLQWTGIHFDVEDIIDIVLDAVQEYRRCGCGELSKLDDIVLDYIARKYPGIDVSYYDGRGLEVGDDPWGAARDLPIRPIVEITPFVVPRPRLLKSLSLPAHYLLLKASSDAFRLGTLRSLFVGHRVKVLKLSRNPLASINGLLDGWKHHCFWQHDLETELDQKNMFSGWCFDLIDGWRQLSSNQDLLSVAKRQWLEPNYLIEEAAKQPRQNEDWFHYRFEDFIRSDNSRSVLLNRVLSDLDVLSDSYFEKAIVQPPEINVTEKNKIARWRNRSSILLPLKDEIEIAKLSRALGYETEQIDEWI